MNEFIEILIKRLKSESPGLFKKLRNWAFWLGSLSSIVLMLPLGLPAWVITVLTLFVGITSGIAGASQLTTNDQTLVNEEKPDG
jgi:hypothetical protein